MLFTMMTKRKMREHARYLVLRGTYVDKTLLIVLRVIFWHEPDEDVWCGRCIEAENIFTVTDEPEKLEWMMADAVASMVEFASKHGFLESLFKEASRKDLKRWNASGRKRTFPWICQIYGSWNSTICIRPKNQRRNGANPASVAPALLLYSRIDGL